MPDFTFNIILLQNMALLNIVICQVVASLGGNCEPNQAAIMISIQINMSYLLVICSKSMGSRGFMENVITDC